MPCSKRNVTNKKIYIALISTVCIVVMSVLIITVWHTEYNESQYIDDWALCNFGQTIDGQKGIEGLDINVIPAWEITKGSSDTIVAVIDTGVDKNCDIFKDTKMLAGWDYYNNDSTTYDQYIHDYHGTYICSAIVKVAPEITLLPIKFMEGTSGSIEDAVKSIEYAIEHNANIINCSWNFYDYSQELYNIIKKNPDVLFVCAAGNYNADLDNVPIYPCSYNLDNIINVLAVDNTGFIYSTSGYGKNSVHIAAPGVAIKVVLPENDETFVDGTSIATAFVSAAAGLILSNDPSLTAVEIKDLLLKSVQPLESVEDLCISGGMVNIYNSIK